MLKLRHYQAGFTVRYVLFILVFSPLFLFAQNNDPRIPQIAPAPGVKSVNIQTVRYFKTKINVEERTPLQVFFDIHPKRDTIWAHHTLVEAQYYSRDGRIDSSYRNHHFPMHSYYTHFTDTSWTYVTWYENTRFDSTIVVGDSARTIRLGPYSSNHRLWYAGDSMHYISYNKKGKSFYHSDLCSSPADSFWDYQSGGPFAKKVVSHAGNRDTVFYRDAKGKWMVKVINHYDSGGHPVMSEYYNRSVKKFDLVSIFANHHVGDATLYLDQYGDRLSMTTRRTYDSNGLLLQEAWFWRNQATPNMVQFYSYDFW
ncbi:MAG TPA: hypothetical protein VK826_02650 [Bacteroidia bacterium]|nr:hypothetical protein [Bacteroidia bacterium]